MMNAFLTGTQIATEGATAAEIGKALAHVRLAMERIESIHTDSVHDRLGEIADGLEDLVDAVNGQ